MEKLSIERKKRDKPREARAAGGERGRNYPGKLSPSEKTITENGEEKALSEGKLPRGGTTKLKQGSGSQERTLWERREAKRLGGGRIGGDLVRHNDHLKNNKTKENRYPSPTAQKKKSTERDGPSF